MGQGGMIVLMAVVSDAIVVIGDVLQKRRPAGSGMAQQPGTIFAAPVVMLNDVPTRRDPQLVEHRSCKLRGPIVCGRLINPAILTDLDADAIGVAFVGARMPADFIDGQALIDAVVVDGEVP